MTPNRSVRLRCITPLLVGALAFGACGGSDDAGGSDDGADSAVSSDDGGGDTASAQEWTEADFERLIATEIDGYTIDSSSVSEFGNASVRYLEDEPGGPAALGATVTFAACDPFTCTDLTAELSEEQRNNIRSVNPRVHLDNPDLVEEVGPTELGGRPALSIYFRSFVDDGTGASTTNSYRAIVHDGTNLITVQVSPDFQSAGGLAQTAEELEARMGAADGAAVADDIIAALAPELG